MLLNGYVLTWQKRKKILKNLDILFLEPRNRDPSSFLPGIMVWLTFVFK